MTSKPEPTWIDSDAHILEHRDLWNHLDKQYRDRVRIVPMTDHPDLQNTTVGSDVFIDDLPIPIWLSGSRQHRFDRVVARFKEKYNPRSGSEPAQYLRDMDTEGMKAVVIYPTLFLFAPWIPNIGAGMGAALARAYNDWIHEFTGADRKRMHPIAVLSLHDVGAAVQEVERCAKRGFVGVFVRPNPLYGRTLSHIDYDPLYRACEANGLSLGIHEGSLSYLPTLGQDRCRNQDTIHCMSHPFELMATMAGMFEAETLHKFPKLNFLFLEGGTALWLPYWLNRLDAERKLHRTNARSELMLPSEYFARQGFVTCEVDDPFLAQLVTMVSDTKLLFSTDYPHMESPFPHSVAEFMKQPISEASRTRISTTNALSAYPRLNS